MNEHELFTHMLFVDAIVGVGFPHQQVAVDAERGGLATSDGEWDPTALETLSTPTLQELYTSLKLYEVSHAH
jgi:hypothetical protein